MDTKKRISSSYADLPLESCVTVERVGGGGDGPGGGYTGTVKNINQKHQSSCARSSFCPVLNGFHF